MPVNVPEFPDAAAAGDTFTDAAASPTRGRRDLEHAQSVRPPSDAPTGASTTPPQRGQSVSETVAMSDTALLSGRRRQISPTHRGPPERGWPRDHEQRARPEM